MKKLSIIFMAFVVSFCIVGCKNDEEVINNENLTGPEEAVTQEILSGDFWDVGVNKNPLPDVPYNKGAGLDIRHDDGTMEVDMFGLYTVKYTFSGEQITEKTAKYSFQSELARDEFAGRSEDEDGVEAVIDGLNVILTYSEDSYKNLTKSQIVDEYEKLKGHYAN